MRQAVIFILLLCLTVHVRTQTTVTVDGMCNIFGAGVTTPPAPGGGGGGVLPAEVDIPQGTKMVVFTSITGVVSCCGGDPGTFNGPEGAQTGSTVLNLIGGISGIIHDFNTMFLTGVFLGPGVTLPAPPGLIFSDNTDFAEISTEIGQTFFIGDGRTGTGEGVLQKFMVPAGATRLFLGFTDAQLSAQEAGYFDDNEGQLNVRVVPIGFALIDAAVDTCSGYADITVESADVPGSLKTFSWSYEGNPLPGQQAPGIRVDQTGAYTVSVEYDFGGIEGTVTCDTSIYIELPLSALDISFATEAADCGSSNGSVSIKISGSDAGIMTSLDGSQFSTNLDYTLLSSGEHVLSIEIEDLCRFDTIINVGASKCPVYIPNVFTPNGDGVNDQFGIVVNEAFTGSIRLFAVYNRSGNLVYERREVQVQDATWDGAGNGLALNPGVYTYIIVLENTRGETESITGDVTLIR